MSLSIAKWEVPFQIATPVATLDLNTDMALSTGSTGSFKLVPQTCSAVIPVRVTDDDIPQGDGQITHERFFAAYELTLVIQLWANDACAAGDDAQEMADMLARVYRGIPRQVSDLAEGRVYWTPDGSPQRMLRSIVLSEALAWNLTDAGLIEATFKVKSQYPYAWDAAETTTALSATLTNTGTADMWPVIKVYGASSAFTITNPAVVDDEGNPLSIVYVGAANPGGSSIASGDYVEINTFNNTMFLNGNGADYTAGLDVLNSDYFPIAVGANPITISGATADVLWQDAWA